MVNRDKNDKLTIINKKDNKKYLKKILKKEYFNNLCLENKTGYKILV